MVLVNLGTFGEGPVDRILGNAYEDSVGTSQVWNGALMEFE